MYFSTQKWAFYFCKSADFLFRISVWSVEFCVVANRSRAFFGAWLRPRTFLFRGLNMGFLKSFLGAMAANSIAEQKRQEQERAKAQKESLNNVDKVLKLGMNFLDYLSQINCRNASFKEIVSDADIDTGNVSSNDVWRTEQLFNGYKRQLKEFMSYGGNPIYIYDFECDSTKMDLYIEIVRKLKEYGWLDKQEQYVKYADDTYWLDQDWKKEQVKREWLSELLTLSTNEVGQITKKDSLDFIPFRTTNEDAVLIERAYFLPQSRDAGTEMFEAPISIKFTDTHIIFYDNETCEEIHYKSTVTNSPVQVLCTRFTDDLTAVDLNGIYVIINTNEVGQVQQFYESHNSRVQNENRQACEGIDTLSGVEFEHVCKRLLENMGFSVETTKASGDGGIDLIGYNTQPLLSGKYIIQCKRYAGSVGEPIIRDLYGVVTSERANKGILLTTGYFTKSAISFAQDKPLELIDGLQLKELINRYLSSDSCIISSVNNVTLNTDTQLTIESNTNKQISVAEECYVHDDAITAVVGYNTTGADEYEQLEERFNQNPSDLKIRCKLVELLHTIILGRISDTTVSHTNFQNAALQLSNLIAPIISNSSIGISREEDYRYYMSNIISGECDIWSGNIYDAVLKWDKVSDEWTEFSGPVLWASTIRGELILSVLSCLEMMGFYDIAQNYRHYWIEKLNNDNRLLEQNRMLITMFGNNETLEKLQSETLESTLVGLVLHNSNDDSTLMCDNDLSFGYLEPWRLIKDGNTIKIGSNDSTVCKEIVSDIYAYVSANKENIVSYFKTKYN